MWPKRFRALTVFATSLALAVATNMPARGYAATGQPAPTPDQQALDAQAATPSTALVAARAADVSARASLASLGDVYAGTVLSPAEGIADVYTTSPSAERQLAQMAGVRAHLVSRSYTDLVGIRDSISKDLTWLRSIGLSPVSWGPDVASNRVIVNVTSTTPSALAAVEAKYGGSVSVAPDGDGALVPYLSRWADAQPWAPGDTVIDSFTYDTCTQGPTIISPSSGNKYALTAGHCASLSASYSNGAPYSAYDPSHFMGQVVYQDVSNNGHDSELIYSNASYNVWRNGGATNVQRVAAPYPQAVNDQVCFGGSLSGEICSATIVAANYCQAGPPNVCNVDAAQRTGVPIAGNGDSGGPVYDVLANGLRIRGVIEGGPTSGHFVTCYYWQGVQGRVCTDKAWYVEITPLLTQWGANLYTP